MYCYAVLEHSLKEQLAWLYILSLSNIWYIVRTLDSSVDTQWTVLVKQSELKSF